MPQEQGTGSETGFVGDDPDNPGRQNVMEAPTTAETQKRDEVEGTSTELLADISDSEDSAVVRIWIDNSESDSIHIQRGGNDAKNDSEANTEDEHPRLEPGDVWERPTTEQISAIREDAATSNVTVNVEREVPGQ